MIKEIAHFPLASVVVVGDSISFAKVHDYADYDANDGAAIIDVEQAEEFIAAVQEAVKVIERANCPLFSDNFWG